MPRWPWRGGTPPTAAARRVGQVGRRVPRPSRPAPVRRRPPAHRTCHDDRVELGGAGGEVGPLNRDPAVGLSPERPPRTVRSPAARCRRGRAPCGLHGLPRDHGTRPPRSRRRGPPAAMSRPAGEGGTRLGLGHIGERTQVRAGLERATAVEGIGAVGRRTGVDGGLVHAVAQHVVHRSLRPVDRDLREIRPRSGTPPPAPAGPVWAAQVPLGVAGSTTAGCSPAGAPGMLIADSSGTETILSEAAA